MDSTFQFGLHNVESSVPLVAPKLTRPQESVHVQWQGVRGPTGHVTVYVKCKCKKWNVSITLLWYTLYI